jgi:hypothetical protein
VTVHCELSVQVARQSPSHLTMQDDEPAHVALLASPSCSLHDALSLHVTADAGPNFKSHVELALHLAELEQASWQSASPQVVLQSAPATHAQAAPEHVQPAPVHSGSGGLPHARPSTIITIAST